MAFKRGFEFVADTAAIGKDMAQPGGRCANGFEDIDRTVAVLNSGGVDQDEHHKNRRCRC